MKAFGHISLGIRLAAACLGLVLVQPAFAQPAAPAKGFTLSRVVVVMRHGVRPPTKAQVVPDNLSTRDWPKWDVPYGYLTAHGTQAITRLGEFDGQTYAGLLGDACTGGKVPSVRIVADTDQRTLATAEAWAGGAIKGCKPPVENAGEGKADPRFSPFEAGQAFDADAGLKSAQAALPKGGLAGLDTANRARLDAISAILGCTKADCQLSGIPVALDAAKGRVKISGGLDTGSTVGQVLMLEYADGKPMSEVGWGLADKARIRDLLTLHALEFQLVARPKVIAEFGARPLLAEVRRGLFATDSARYTLLVGHDSNLAYIGGALGLHWTGGDFPQDDPPPGGAIVFELWKNKAGAQKIVVRFRSQTLDEIRDLSPLKAGALTTLKPAICNNQPVCEGDRFEKTLAAMTD
ncbi:MAG TPA: histidine-type phosphatase [Asticcacaulis sp.]|nr:histidine-type phosphatase [Asticcacaulis sp.]